MDYSKTLAYMAIMAGVTYLVRMIPMVFLRRRVTNTFVLSFLFYVPYAVLGAMTIPAILYSTQSFLSALCGTAAALFLAYRGKSITTVALVACGTVFIVERLAYLMA